MEEEYNDYELICYAKEENEEAKNILIKKYEPLIISCVNSVLKHRENNGLEKSDLIQEGMIALNHAIETFDENKEALFYTYAKKCIVNKLISTLISSSRYKNKILNESVSYDAEDTKLLNIIKDSNPTPDEIVINSYDDLIKQIKLNLTSYEMQVFDLLIKEFDYKEISQILNKDIKSIDNAIQRIKLKIKKILNK